MYKIVKQIYATQQKMGKTVHNSLQSNPQTKTMNYHSTQMYLI